jgi:glycosyltransferase involved in cell wall biosynthesis
MNIYSTHLIEKISKENLVILGICRNVESDLESDVIKLIDAFQDFKSVHFRLVESDSTDGTLQVLERLSHQIHNFEFVSVGDLESTIPSRVKRIAHCRNICLQLLQGDSRLSGANYVAISDFDGVNSLLTRKGVLSCWEREDWDVCTANQDAPYYDIFALRHRTWSPNNCWKYESELMRGGMNPASAREKAVYSRQKRIPQNSPWIQVESAFGGLAIYRRNCLNGVSYNAVYENGEEDCEHIFIHKQIADKGYKIFINPKFINLGWNGHNESQLLRNRFKRLIKRILYTIVWKFK